MLKRMMACLLAVCLLAACAALAAGEYIGDMKVINCKQAVNLRQKPGTDSASLGLVPLNAVVNSCSKVEGSDWVQVTYQGVTGYIRGDYLEAVPLEEQYTNEDTILTVSGKGLNVSADQFYEGTQERLVVTCADNGGNVIWSRETVAEITELTQTDAFVSGTPQNPFVIMYNAQEGLYALDPATGEVRWQLMKDQIDLGASICHALASDGTLYIAGYYGPDPVAIDMSGNVLWQADSGSDEIFWLYAMELRSDGLACHYDSLPDGKSGWVIYDFSGAVKEIVTD